MLGKINYGFGKEYLPNWGLKEALREVLQNYIDYKDYSIETFEHEDDSMLYVRIVNNYKPDKLEFLRIGNSDKHNNVDAIGHHGEGLKMAFLIFLREELKFEIVTPYLIISANWHEDDMIGTTMCIHYCDNFDNREAIGFDTCFECPRDVYKEFIDNIITERDIICNCRFGSVVNKPKGNLYSGNLFVCNIKELSRSYDIKPQYLSLDRDRSVPSDWDVTYYTSQINSLYNSSETKVTTEELESKDYRYVSKISDNIVNQFTIRKINNNNVYINKVDNKHLQNRNITDLLDKHSKFVKAKKVSNKQQLKYKIEASNKKSLKTLLNNFKKSYCHTRELKEDITIIINRYNKERNGN
jgi:hypothetical protein